MVVHLSFLISPLASVCLLASVACLLSLPVLPRSSCFSFCSLCFCFVGLCFLVSFRPLPPSSRSLPSCLFLFVGVLPPPKRCSLRNARIHTQGATHKHTQHTSHTQTQSRVAVSHSHTHPHLTHTHTRAYTHRPHRRQRANQRTHAHNLRTRTAGHAHPRVRLHVLACVSQSALCVEQPCLHLGVRCCRWSVLACHDVLRPCVSQRGRTALHWAAANGHAPCIEVLLRAGADISTQDKVSAVITPHADWVRLDMVD